MYVFDFSIKITYNVAVIKASANKKIVITGGGGFIGANLIRKLLKLDYQVYVIWKKSSNSSRLFDVKDKISLNEVDIFDKKKLTNFIKKIRPFAIIHLATHTSYRNQQDLEQIYKTALTGTLNLLLASKDVDYKIFINTGSSSEYGFKNKPMKETDFLEPVSFYAASKAGQSLLCQTFSYHFKKPIITIRPFSVYGPFEQKDRFIPTIVRSVINKKTIKLTPGKQRRDFIFIDDLVDTYIKAIKKADKLSGKILNVGTGIEYTNDEIVNLLFKVTKQKVKLDKGAYPTRIWDNPHWVADIKNTRKLLNWKPKYTLEKGLKTTYDWFLKNNSLYED